MLTDEQGKLREYRRLQNLLLVLVGVLALEQGLLSFFVLAALLRGLYLAYSYRKEQELRALPKGLHYLLLALLVVAYGSLHMPAMKNPLICTFNLFYVVGQYAAVIWLFSHFGSYFATNPKFGIAGTAAAAAASKAQGTRLTELPPSSLKFLPETPSGAEHLVPGLPGKGGLRARYRALPFPLKVLVILAAVGGIVVLIGIAQHFLRVAPTDDWIDTAANPDLKTRAYSTWQNPNILAGYLCTMAAYTMGFISVSRNSRFRWELFAYLLGVLLCLVYTYSRGFYVAVAVEVLAFVFFFYRRGLYYLGGVVAIGAMTAGPAFIRRLETLQNITQDTSAEMRLAYLEIVTAIIKDNPWGIGWYNYLSVFPEYDYYFKDPSVIMYHCHNLLLNITVELGYQGLILFVAVWGYFLWQAWSLHKRGRARWLVAMGRGYILMSLGMLVGGLGDHVYFNVRLGILFWILSVLVAICTQFNEYRDGRV